jgi:hypothetical protein
MPRQIGRTHDRFSHQIRFFSQTPLHSKGRPHTPYAPTLAMCRDLPVGRECVRSPSLLLSRKPFRPQNRLRLKTNFSRAFKSMTPVQISRKKYSVLCSPQISGFISLSRLVQRGVSRSSRTWRRAAVAAKDRSILFGMRTNDRFADGQAVWSWRPDAGAKPARRTTRSLRVTVAKEPGHRGEHRVRRKTIAQGRPGILG